MSLDSSGSDLDAAYGPAQAPVAQAPVDDLDAAYPPPDVTPKASKEKDKNPYDPNRVTFGHELGDAIEEGASGAYHSIVGGYKGLYTAATTRDMDKAAAAVNAETAKSYQAPKPTLANAPAALRPSIEAMQPPGVEGLGNFAGNTAEALGAPPQVSAMAKAGAEVFGPLAGGVREANVPPKLNAQGVVDRAAATQSMGAAGTAPNVSQLSPELQNAIVESGGGNRDVLTRHIEAETLPIPAKLTEGQATQDPGIISEEQNMRGGEAGAPLRDNFQAQNQNLIENLDEMRRNAAPTAVGNDEVQNGRALVDKYKAYDEPIKADISAKYKALADANGGDLPVDGNSFVNAADAALKKQNKARYLPPEVRGTLDDLREGGNFTFNNFENLRTDLAAAGRKAQRAGDGNAQAAINIARNELEKLPMTGDAATTLKPLADAARSAAKARFDAKAKDPAYAAAIDDDAPKGELSPLANSFVEKYVLGGTKAGLREMKSKFANDPEASGTITASALNYMKKRAGIDAYTNTGNFSQSGYNKARAELEPHMDELLDPETAENVRKLGNVARYQQMQPRGSYVNNSNTFTAGAAKLAEHAANLVPLPMGVKLGSSISKVFEGNNAAARVQRALKPGAGLDYRNKP